MKKICSFIAMLLMCFMTTANAQHSWKFVGDEFTNVSEVLGGNDHYYVMRGAACQDNNGKPAFQADLAKFICLNKKSEELTHECVFQFIELDTKGDFKVYGLKNVSNGMFLTVDNTYDSSKAKAFRFTIQRGQYMDEAAANEATWDEYSCAVSATRSQGAVEAGAWVMCSPSEKRYIIFYGNPGLKPFIDTNNWLIGEVEEETMTELDKLLATYNQYFANYTSPEDIDLAFPVGTTPGCVSQEFLDHFKAVYQQASDLLSGVVEVTETACKEANEAIIKLFEEEMSEAVIPVSAGCFVLKNMHTEQRGFLTIAGDGKTGRVNPALKSMGTVEGTDYDSWTPESMASWNMNNAKFIWVVEESQEEPGKLLFKNFASEKYLTHVNNKYPMADESTANGTLFSVNNYSGLEFLITYGTGGMLHASNHTDGALLNYAHPEDAGSRWRFYAISDVVTDSLTALVQQNALNNELRDLSNRAKNDYFSLQYDNYVEGDAYNAPADSGLTSSVMGANANRQGKTGAELFDNDLNTFYHTEWDEKIFNLDEKIKEGDHHWVQVDLGKEVTNLRVKFTKRQNQANCHINKYAIYSASETVNYEEVGEELAVSEDSIAFSYGNNNTHIQDYTLKSPARYIRFVVLSTRGRDVATNNSMTAGTGPYWHLSELRFYDPADIKANAGFTAIPDAVKATLTAAIEKANTELKEKKATQATIDELNKALEAFWDAYPDATNLKNALESTAKMIEGAEEGEGMGFFEVGAKDELSAVVAKLQAAVSEKETAGVAFTLEEIKAYEKELDEAVAAFNAKLHKPVAGHIYQIVCMNGFNEDGSEKEQNDNMVISSNADYENGSPSHRYKNTDDDGSHFNSYWLVEETAEGLAFKNLANGLYMNNPFEGLTEEEIKDLELPNNLIGYSKTPKSFKLEAFTAEGELSQMGYFLMSLTKNKFVNFESTGNLVRWWDRNDPNSALTFIDAEDGASFEGVYQIPVKAGKANIVTLPIEVQGVHVGDEDVIYKVLGLKDNKMQLQQADGAEGVAAGHPFIVCPAEGVESIEVDVNPSLYDNITLKYNYEPVVENGLVSAPIGFTTEEGQGYGVLINNVVVASTGGDYIAAGSGFFNKSILPTEEDGDVVLEVEGVISGEGTAVENVEIVKNVPSDVYTVSGVKVRHNVKAGVATQGLPKGIYIVGGKKVVVK